MITIKNIKKLFSYYKPYYKLFLMDIFCALIQTTVLLIFPLLISHITNYILIKETINKINEIYFIGIIMILLVVIFAICNCIVTYYGHIMGTYMERDIRNELFNHIQKFSFSFFDKNKTAYLISRLTNDSLNLTELFHHGPEDLIISLLSFSAFIILAKINFKLTIIIIFFLLIIFIYTFFTAKKMNFSIKKNQEQISNINTQIEDQLNGIKITKSFSNENFEKNKFYFKNNLFLESKKNTYKHETIFYEGFYSLMLLMKIFIIIYGSLQITNKTLKLSDLLTFLLYLEVLIEPIKKFGNLIRLYQEGISGFNRILEILKINPDIRDSENAIEIKNFSGKIEFKNVSFKYNENYILKNLSFNIYPREYIALVGYSGNGKTTLCSLIPRFYDINKGKILLDNKDIKNIKIDSLRKNIGFVQQDSYLFSETILNNIKYGKLDSSNEEIIEASKKADSHDFIISLPEGYNTVIGEKGIKLSGGQKQRINIARVFLKNPPILIFDEATSSLDNESENYIKNSLEKLKENRTIIVIAHRLSTIKNVQKIFFLDKNGIPEIGTHEELISLNKNYANLYKQFN